MTEFLTSDPHLFHPLLATLRGFESPADFNEMWADHWAQTVTKRDNVWILGDLTGGGHVAEALNLLARLPGRKHLILGNHDPAHPLNRDSHNKVGMYYPTFTSVQTFARKNIGGISTLLSHFPYSSGVNDHNPDREDRFNQWRLPDLGTPLIHGHTHSSIGLSQSSKGTLQVNVAWEVSGGLVPAEALSVVLKQYAQ